MFSLAQKTALVTGAGSGIGQAIAQLFAQQGAFVWVVERDALAGRNTVDSIKVAGGQADLAELDVSDPAALEGAIMQVGQIRSQPRSRSPTSAAWIMRSSASSLRTRHARATSIGRMRTRLRVGHARSALASAVTVGSAKPRSARTFAPA